MGAIDENRRYVLPFMRPRELRAMMVDTEAVRSRSNALIRRSEALRLESEELLRQPLGMSPAGGRRRIQ